MTLHAAHHIPAPFGASLNINTWKNKLGISKMLERKKIYIFK